jgi:type I restriction enzyme, S subunit
MSNSRWPLVSLGKIISYRKEFVTIDDHQPYKRCRVQLGARGIVLRDVIPGSEIKTKEQQVCTAGEFLVAEIDAKHGGYGIVPSELDGAIVSSHYFLFTIDGGVLDRDYLGWYSKTAGFFEQVAAQGSTNYASIRPQQVLSYVIPLPPVAEQRRIVAQLGGVSQHVMEARRRLEGVMHDLSATLRNFIRSAESRGGTEIRLSDLMKLRLPDTKVDPEANYQFAGVYSFGRGVFRARTISGSETRYSQLTQLKCDNFVYPKLMAWEGALGSVPQDCHGRYVSPEFCAFEVDSTRVSPRIVDVYFETLQHGPCFSNPALEPIYAVEGSTPMISSA